MSELKGEIVFQSILAFSFLQTAFSNIKQQEYSLILTGILTADSQMDHDRLTAGPSSLTYSDLCFIFDILVLPCKNGGSSGTWPGALSVGSLMASVLGWRAMVPCVAVICPTAAGTPWHMPREGLAEWALGIGLSLETRQPS